MHVARCKPAKRSHFSSKECVILGVSKLFATHLGFRVVKVRVKKTYVWLITSWLRDEKCDKKENERRKKEHIRRSEE